MLVSYNTYTIPQQNAYTMPKWYLENTYMILIRHLYDTYTITIWCNNTYTIHIRYLSNTCTIPVQYLKFLIDTILNMISVFKLAGLVTRFVNYFYKFKRNLDMIWDEHFFFIKFLWINLFTCVFWKIRQNFQVRSKITSEIHRKKIVVMQTKLGPYICLHVHIM